MTTQNNTIHPTAQKVLDFWFNPDNQTFWFAKNDDFDMQIREQFYPTWQQAKSGECADWRTVNGETNTLRNSLLGRLAEIIVLDQFSRNLARNTPDSFAQDGMALVLAQEAIALTQIALPNGEFPPLTQAQQAFLFMPFMHSESAKIHEQALVLFTNLGNPNNLDFEKKHQAIIDRFGRYPHRNAILGRESTPEEIEFLKQAGSSF